MEKIKNETKFHDEITIELEQSNESDVIAKYLSKLPLKFFKINSYGKYMVKLPHNYEFILNYTHQSEIAIKLLCVGSFKIYQFKEIDKSFHVLSNLIDSIEKNCLRDVCKIMQNLITQNN